MAFKLFAKQNASFLLVPIVTLAFLPNNYDPFNLPKLWGFILTVNFLFLVNTNTLKLKLNPRIKMIFILLVFSITCGTVKSSSISSAVFGNYAQNTGWLTLLMCILLAIIIIKLEQENLSNLFMQSIGITGVLVSLYAFIQERGIDPVKWSQEGWIVSTLGNPNFTSSFLAIAFLILITYWDFENNHKLKTVYAASAAMALIGCSLADSDQGYVIIFVGTVTILILKVLRNKNRRQRIVIFTSSTIIVCVVIATLIFSTTKLTFLQSSLQFRVYYWETSINMFRENILFGVGYANFEDSFHKYRSLDHFLYGKGEFAASSHNYFLEWFALGGILAGTSYILVCIFITAKMIRLIQQQSEKKSKNVQLLAVSWIGYVLQSLISIPVVPMLVIGTIIGSLIIKTNLKSVEKSKQIANQENSPVNLITKRVFIFGSCLILIINVIISSTMLIKDNNFKNIIDFQPSTENELSLKLSKYRQVMDRSLYSQEYSFMFAKNLFNQGLGYDAELIMKETFGDTLHSYKKNWYLAYFNSNVGKSKDAIEFFLKAKNLDPKNLNLRKDLILLLRRENFIDKAKNELEELANLAPNSDQYKSLTS